MPKRQCRVAGNCRVWLENRVSVYISCQAFEIISNFGKLQTEALTNVFHNFPGFPTTRTRLQKGIRLAIYCVFLFIREDHLELATQLPFGCSSEVLSLLPRALKRLVRTGLCQSALLC